MDKKHVLKKVYEAFYAISKPKRISSKSVHIDNERMQIEEYFKNADRDNMSYEEVSMMLVDGALIDPDAYLYFLPKLAETVLIRGADGFLLNLRLKDINYNNLTSKQAEAIESLITILNEIESAFDAED